MTTLIKKVLGEEAGQVVEIGNRFCSQLGMGNQEMCATQEVARRLDDALDVWRNTESIADAISYMVVQRAGSSKTVKDVSLATSVAEATIKGAHKDLTPHVEHLFA